MSSHFKFVFAAVAFENAALHVHGAVATELQRWAQQIIVASCECISSKSEKYKTNLMIFCG